MKTIEQYTYNTFDTIGKGYSSQVYKGKNDRTNQQVAIKLIDLKFIKGDVHKKLLQNQISVLKQLKNRPNIIQMYDVYVTKSSTCIVTQLCSEDLAKTIKTRKCLPQNEALLILKQIINGYRSLHDNHIIHRDLKPANIFLSNEQIKIADFGFAVGLENLKKKETYNVGSPVYMPFQALNENVYSGKSDVWAIGVIYYEMLTGRTPWRAKTEGDLKRMLKHTAIRTLLPTNISKLSQDFLVRTLTFEPENRMSPEQMLVFLDNSNRCEFIDQPLQQRKPHTAIVSNTSCYRTRAASQQNSQRPSNPSSLQANNHISGQKTYKKINILKGVPTQECSDNKFIKTRTSQKEKSSNDGSFQSIDPKKVSNQLVSQLHLCRFLFKLIERINKNCIVDQTEIMRNQMAQLIFKKLNEIRNLTMLSGQIATQYRQTVQFSKLYRIIEQYTEKYIKALGTRNLYMQNHENLQQLLLAQIKSLYSLILQYQQNPEQKRDEVILLDYLITLKQLLTLDEKVDVENFWKRSKIQQIVEGKPTMNITKDHITAISNKIKAMKIF